MPTRILAPTLKMSTRHFLNAWPCGEYRSRTDDLLRARQALQPAELIPHVVDCCLFLLMVKLSTINQEPTTSLSQLLKFPITILLPPFNLFPFYMKSSLGQAYRIKYGINFSPTFRLVVSGRLELPTSTLSVQRSNQLSYETGYYCSLIVYIKKLTAN